MRPRLRLHFGEAVVAEFLDHLDAQALEALQHGGHGWQVRPKVAENATSPVIGAEGAARVGACLSDLTELSDSGALRWLHLHCGIVNGVRAKKRFRLVAGIRRRGALHRRAQHFARSCEPRDAVIVCFVGVERYALSLCLCYLHNERAEEVRISGAEAPRRGVVGEPVGESSGAESSASRRSAPRRITTTPNGGPRGCGSKWTNPSRGP